MTVPGFNLEDSGQHQRFNTGSRRDTALGKPRPDLLSPFFRLRLGMHLMLGAIKYGAAHNWARGQSTARYRESLDRHLMEADMGLTDEDHLSAAVFNIMGMLHNAEMKALGALPAELDDWPVDWVGLMHGADPENKYNYEAAKKACAEAAVAAAKYLETLRIKLQAKQYDKLHADH